jgi:GNAT superfamily N-acetyltransferase
VASTDPDNIGAEFGIVVRSDLKGGGLGQKLMDKLIACQRGRGTQRLQALVLRDNTRMLALALALALALEHGLGSTADALQTEADTLMLTLAL